jgi:pimeloyl-ACP methyl ester carboxylesterase
MVQVGSRFRENFVDADGFRVRYLEAGEGQPVLYIHGAGGLDVGLAEELLADTYRVIAVELPGFGASAVNERTKTPRDLARTVALVASQLGLDRYSVIGASFGGRVATWLSLDYPDQVEALVLAAPATVLPPGFRPGGGSREELEAKLYAHPERRSQASAPDAATMQQQQQLIGRIKGLEPDAELEGRLAEVQAPTLVLFGTRDGIISSDLGRIYRERMPNCSLVIVYDAAHAIASDRPESYASTVADFLERHEVFVVSRETTVINP